MRWILLRLVNLPRPSSLHRKPREIRPVLRRIGNTVSVCVRSDRLDHDGRRCLPDQPMLLASFIAANAWMSRQPMSLQSICSNVLELYKNRDEITDNEKWRQELEHLHDDCAVALYKYDPTSAKYELTGTR